MKPQTSGWHGIVNVIISDLYGGGACLCLFQISLCAQHHKLLSFCHSTLTSSSSSISRCHQNTSLDFQCTVLCYRFQLVWTLHTPADHQHTHGTQHCVFYIYCPKVRYREWKGLVPGLIPVEQCMIVWLDLILHGRGLHQSPLFETHLLGNCVASLTWSHLPWICISAC